MVLVRLRNRLWKPPKLSVKKEIMLSWTLTRMSQEAADLVGASLPLRYDALSRTGIVGELPEKDGNGKVVIATGGTSDVPVAEEAALTAEVSRE